MPAQPSRCVPEIASSPLLDRHSMWHPHQPTHRPLTLGTIQPTSHPFTMYSLQVYPLLHPKSLSVTPVSPGPRSKSNIQQAPATIASQHIRPFVIHTPPNVTQRKPRQVVNLISKPSHACRLIFHPTHGSNETALSCVDHAVRSLSEIWQDDYLSVYTTTKVATQPPTTSGSQESVGNFWNPVIQRRVQQLPSPIPPSTVETPPLSSMAPSLNGPNGACLSGKPGVAPLQGFFQELIHHSHTSGTALQTALCYIEAVGRKLPEIASTSVPPRKETAHKESSQDGELPSPEPPIPSPLLFPHRTFLTSLNPGNHWLDLEATLIYRSVRRISVGLQVGPLEEAGRSLATGSTTV